MSHFGGSNDPRTKYRSDEAHHPKEAATCLGAPRSNKSSAVPGVTTHPGPVMIVAMSPDDIGLLLGLEPSGQGGTT